MKCLILPSEGLHVLAAELDLLSHQRINGTKPQKRATDLEKGLRELLDDVKGSGLVRQVYDHGMINGLFKGNYDPAASDKSNLPSYIPSRNVRAEHGALIS
jgi:hypothetical protein